VIKLVVLKFGKGSFATGFPVLLQLGEENALPSTEVTGELPADPQIPLQFNQWQTIYRSLDLSGRPKGLPKPTQGATVAECHQAAEQLSDRLNHWLRSDSFRPIREKCLEKLHPSESIRLILQTENLQLQKLPWHLWELLERYPKAEIALSTPHYERREQPAITTGRVKILALFGDSSGIDLSIDRETLQRIPQTTIQFMVEPTHQELTDQLWQSAWHILFFAGHSASERNGQTGRLYINATESLTIQQLKYALQKAVDRGLRLAIFNSCDGLGLAREFADLNIPQLIVMREPVPDRIAQLFLKYFLEAFSRGESLYLAVREARERLQGMESQFPCATWLPVICQNPAEIPPSWQDLVTQVAVSDKLAQTSNSDLDKRLATTTFPDLPSNLAQTAAIASPVAATPAACSSKRGKPKWLSSLTVLLESMAIATLVLGVRYFGVLQPLELQTFDQLLRLRPSEPPDPRILIVTVTEADVAAQANEARRGSLSDQSLAKLLEKLSAHQPSVIGLDIYRDYAVGQTLPQVKQVLTQQLQQNKRLIAICRVSDPKSEEESIAPPAEVPADRIGFSDFVFDEDGVVRRHLLALTPPPSSSCSSTYALNVQLTLRYLATQNIALQFTPSGEWQLGKLRFRPIESHTGGYQGIDARGHQILLNYRSAGSPEELAPQATLTQVLNDQVDANAIKDRIILIGTTAQSFQDYSLTPYSRNQMLQQKNPGVVLQAQMVSQLVSAALGERSLLWTWNLGEEVIWVLGWSVLGGTTGAMLRRFSKWLLVNGCTFALLSGTCFVVLVQWNGWLPLVPAAIALITSSTVVYFVCLKQQGLFQIKF
jgi:CHASE2 domain-containing sensor protein